MQKAQAGALPLSSTIFGRHLAVLTGAVLLAHLVLLHNTPLLLDAPDPISTRAFTTRTLQINAPAAQAEAPAAYVPPPAPAAHSLSETKPVLAPTPVAKPRSSGQAAAVPEPEAPRYDLGAPLAPQQAAAPNAPASAPAPQPLAQAPAAASSPPTPTAQAAVAPLTKDAALVARSYTVPGSVRLKYNATGRQSKMDYTASAELLWLQDGSTYNARLEVSAFLLGARVFSSAGHMTADGLAPDRFADKTRSEQAAHFERDKGRVTFSANTPEASLLPGAQDRLSVFIQLAAMVAGEPQKYPLGTTITVQTVSRRAADTWVFTVDAEEKLRLPGGELATIRLLCNPRKDFDQKVEVWLAPALAYMPARIRVTEANGDFVDQQWRSTAAP